jgi:anti-sigma factor (TIGR02949 family)
VGVAEPVRCQVVLALLPDYLDGEADAACAPIGDHLRECPACASRAGFEQALKMRLAGLAEAKAPPALRRRLRQLIGAL